MMHALFSVPSAARNLTVGLVNSTLIGSWDAPSVPNGIVTYEINITSLDLATGNYSTLRLSFIMRSNSDRQVEFTVMDEPYVQYTVSVLARTGGGTSEAVMDTVNSDQGGM